MLSVYQPAVPIRAAIVFLDLVDAPGRIEVEELTVLGVQALVLPANRGEFPTVRHELVAWDEEMQLPQLLLDVSERRRDHPNFLSELVMAPVTSTGPTFELLVEAAKQSLTAEFERRQKRKCERPDRGLTPCAV
jgi:hypothetical protein